MKSSVTVVDNESSFRLVETDEESDRLQSLTELLASSDCVFTESIRSLSAKDYSQPDNIQENNNKCRLRQPVTGQWQGSCQNFVGTGLLSNDSSQCSPDESIRFSFLNVQERSDKSVPKPAEHHYDHVRSQHNIVLAETSLLYGILEKDSRSEKKESDHHPTMLPGPQTSDAVHEDSLGTRLDDVNYNDEMRRRRNIFEANYNASFSSISDISGTSEFDDSPRRSPRRLPKSPVRKLKVSIRPIASPIQKHRSRRSSIGLTESPAGQSLRSPWDENSKLTLKSAEISATEPMTIPSTPKSNNKNRVRNDSAPKQPSRFMSPVKVSKRINI